MSIPTPRRYHLLKRRAALARGDGHLAGFWRAKQATLAWPALPADFPSRAALVAAGYTTVRDLDGADTTELRALGLTRDAADAVVAAMEDWSMIAHTLAGYTRSDGAFAAVYDCPLVPSAAYAATFTSDTYETGADTTLRLLLDVTACTGAVDVLVQTSHDGVTDWRNLLAFAQKTAAGQSERQCVAGADRFVRAVCTITTGPVTFSVTGESA